MTEANDRTQDITLYDEFGNPVKIVLIDGVYRLSVDANISATVIVDTFSSGAKINEFASVSPTTHPTTLLSYTVTTGKNLFIENWQAGSIENVKMVLEFRIAGVKKDKIGFHLGNKDTLTIKPFGIFAPIKATSGQLVEIVSISGDTGKEVNISFNGTEI